MRKVLSILLACSLVLLCACGKQTQDTDKPQDTPPSTTTAAPVTTTKAPYDRLLAATEQDAQAAAICAAIDGQDFTTAYTLLKEWDNPLKQALLAQFVFVPTAIRTTIRSETSDMHFSTELTYDKQGNPLKHVHTDKGNKTETVYTYDANGRLSQEMTTSDYSHRTTTYDYDTAGRLTRKHHATENTFGDSIRRDETTYTYAYDEKGNLTEEKRVSAYSDGGGEEVTTTYTYNESGKETYSCTVFENGNRSEQETEYRADGTLYKVTERIANLSDVYINEYDEQERLWKEWVVEAEGYTYAKRTYHYDNQDRVVQIDRYPATVDFAATITYEFDEAGNLLCETEGLKQTVYTYDENGNRLTTVRTGTGYNWSKQYTYDANGNVLTETITYGDGLTESTANTYDGDGNRLTQTYEGFSSETGEAITITENVAWTLFFYPDGVPEVVEEELYSLTIPPNAA